MEPPHHAGRPPHLDGRSGIWAFSSCTQARSRWAASQEKSLAGGGPDSVQVGTDNPQHRGFRMNRFFGMDRWILAGTSLTSPADRGVALWEFKTKASRLSPYFFNAGLFNDGASPGPALRLLRPGDPGVGLAVDVLFGPAYKGIALAAGTAIALASRTGGICPIATTAGGEGPREGGTLVGAPLAARY